MNKQLLKNSFLMAAGELIYIFLVVLFMRNANRILGNDQNIVSTISFLLLVVLSASVSGALIFGKPVLLFMEGKKKESITFFAYTLGWIILFLLLAISISALF